MKFGLSCLNCYIDSYSLWPSCLLTKISFSVFKNISMFNNKDSLHFLVENKSCFSFTLLDFDLHHKGLKIFFQFLNFSCKSTCEVMNIVNLLIICVKLNKIYCYMLLFHKIPLSLNVNSLCSVLPSSKICDNTCCLIACCELTYMIY